MSLRVGQARFSRDVGAPIASRATQPKKPNEASGGPRSRYEALVKIGSGGTASVYIGRFSGTAGFSRLFAMKRLHPHLVDDPAAHRMVFTEARLSSRIHHANVVAVHDLEQHAGETLLVLDYVEGGTLAELVDGGAARGLRLPPRVAMRILLDACAGLAAVHEVKGDDGGLLGFVHGDVSPHNILVGVDGIARVTDFGLAKLMEDPRASGALSGKLAYLAPEVLREGRFGVQSDVFAMGICAWEAFAERRLFRGENEADTLRRVSLAAAPRLSTIARGLGADLDAVVARALEKSTGHRYGSIRELGSALLTIARSHDLYATSEEVGAYVEEIVGGAIARRRQLVRQHEGEVPSDVLYRQTASIVPKNLPLYRSVDTTPTTNIRTDLRAHLERLKRDEADELEALRARRRGEADPEIEVEEIEVELDEIVLLDTDEADETELFSRDEPWTPPELPEDPPSIPEPPPTLETPPPAMSLPAMRPAAPPAPISLAPPQPLPLLLRARSHDLPATALPDEVPLLPPPPRPLPVVLPPPLPPPERAKGPAVLPLVTAPFPKVRFAGAAAEPAAARLATESPPLALEPRAATTSTRERFQQYFAEPDRGPTPRGSRGSLDDQRLRLGLLAIIAFEVVLLLGVLTGVIPRGRLVTTDVAHHELGATPPSSSTAQESRGGDPSSGSGHAAASSQVETP